MKKFLCYDTNDAASGKIGVNNNGVLSPNATVPSTNGSAYQQLVTDGEGNVKWEDRLAYEDSKLVIDVGHGVQIVKVADEVPSWASIDAPIKVWDSNGSNATVTPEQYRDLGNGSFMGKGIPLFIATDNFEHSGLVIPEKGVYFFSVGSEYMTGIASADSDTPEITWDGNIGGIKKIDEKYLHTSVPVIKSATVGQTIRVSSVDENGVPTGWEAVKQTESVMIVNCTGSQLDATFSEMSDALNSGRAVAILAKRYDGDTHRYLFWCDWKNGENYLSFSYLDAAQRYIYNVKLSSSSTAFNWSEAEIIYLTSSTTPPGNKRGLILSSSTPSSTKDFEITVDDTGTITATEVTS